MPKGGWREFDDPSTSKRERFKSRASKAECNVRVQKKRGGKGGKTVTVITGLELDEAQSRHLLKRFKASCGTGGTLKGVVLELQGDQVKAVLELLRKDGYSPKQSGG